jgi:hypothetical protein
MKWYNNYDLTKFDEINEIMNPYKTQVAFNSNGNKIFSEGLKSYNYASFKKKTNRSGTKS